MSPKKTANKTYLTRRWFCLGAGLVACKIRPARAHGFHASFSVVEHNARSDTWEIFHRIIAADLESVLTARAGEPVTLDNNPASAKLVESYLLDVFSLKTDQGKALKPAWVGMKVLADALMVYQEVKNSGPLAGIAVNSQILTETNPGQINTVNVTFKGRTQTALFKMNDPTQVLMF
jgi:hypothetical protein